MTNSSLTIRLAALFQVGALGGLLATSSCSGGTGTTDGQEVCGDCNTVPNKPLYRGCYCEYNGQPLNIRNGCFASEKDAEDDCEEECGKEELPNPQVQDGACWEAGTSTGTTLEIPTTGGEEEVGASPCVDWSPSLEVSLIMGTRYLSGDYLSDLVNDPSPLVLCDDASLQLLVTGGFEVNDADAGELLYELGLRDGDVPLELNGLPLDSYEDGWHAFGELYLSPTTSSFELSVQRGLSTISLYFEVVYTL